MIGTSSTNKTTGSLLGAGVLKSLSNRLEACSGVAFFPVRSYKQLKERLVSLELLPVTTKKYYYPRKESFSLERWQTRAEDNIKKS